jgi:hypothetical protein
MNNDRIDLERFLFFKCIPGGIVYEMQTYASTYKLLRKEIWWNQIELGCCLFHDECSVKKCSFYLHTVIVYT